MKKRVRQYAQQIQLGTQDRRHVLKDFSRMLDNQVFLLSLLNDFAILNGGGSFGSFFITLKTQIRFWLCVRNE